MSWEQLAAIFREQREEYDRARWEPPVACPNDGEPLIEVDGVLRCKFDGWTWQSAYDF